MSEYGQRPAMEDESMVGTLEAQAHMIWPLEQPVLEALGLGTHARILDLGCGTGEIAGRVAGAWPDARVLGIDLYETHVEIARRRHRPLAAGNLEFRAGDAYALDLENGAVDAVLLRHLLHALPDRSSLYAEVRRVLAPQGLLWVLAEDYAGLLFDADGDARSLFLDAREGMQPTGTELFHGRTAWRELRAAGFTDVRVHPIVVPTTAENRPHWQAMLRHWRDGYAAFIARGLGREEGAIAARFDALIEATGDPERYSCWLLFGASARR